MSFDKLIQSSVAKKQEEIVIDGMTFYANELSITHSMKLAKIESEDGDTYTYWVAYSITDQEGKRMSYDQARQLPVVILKKFLDAALRVNSKPKAKDTKKKNQKKTLPKKRNFGAN